MSKRINLENSSSKPISIIGETDDAELGIIKGWSFINIYDLLEFRNLYLAMNRANFKGEITKFMTYCQEHVPYKNKPWSYRKVEEYINAFRNFGIVVNDKVKEEIFLETDYAECLSDADKKSLMRIYYSYIRFREIHTWFTKIDSQDRRQVVLNFNYEDLITEATQLYSFSSESRFTNSFINTYSNNATIYTLDENTPVGRRLIRFWDVYIAWGKTLGIVEKFSLETIDMGLQNKKALSCTYHLNPNQPTFSLREYIKTHFGHRKVFVPELVSRISLENRISIDATKTFIISEYVNCREHFTLDNTSEIFFKLASIKDRESILYPIYRDLYISHITLIQ